MEATFGQRLAAARRVAGYKTQQSLADAIGVSARTIRNYEGDRHRPDAATLAALTKLVGEFADDPGDPVEVAIRRSELQPHRQSRLIAVYQEQLYEQRREEAV